MNSAEVLPDDEALRAWDWHAELKRQERGIPWLARQTNRHQNTVYMIKWGQLRPSIAWLRDVARVLGKEGVR